MEARVTVTGIKDVDELVDVIKKLGSNTTIECKLDTEKKQEVETDLVTAFVSHSGITIRCSKYWSEGLIDLLGRRVLVTKPKDGKIKVHSIEGQYLTEAFVMKEK